MDLYSTLVKSFRQYVMMYMDNEEFTSSGKLWCARGLHVMGHLPYSTETELPI